MNGFSEWILCLGWAGLGYSETWLAYLVRLLNLDTRDGYLVWIPVIQKSLSRSTKGRG